MPRFRVVTLNDDFTTPRRTDARFVFRRRVRQVGAVLARVSMRRRRQLVPAAVLTQEAKTHHYADLLPPDYGVTQHTGTDAEAGVAVLWDKAQAVARGVGSWRLLCAPNGARMLGRGVVWQHVDLGGTTVVLASAHRPPKRYRHLWATFDRNLTRWVGEQSHPVILGMDVNVGWRGRRRLARGLGMRQRGKGIDAVFVSPPLRPRKATRLRRRSSDHRAVQVEMVVP